MRNFKNSNKKQYLNFKSIREKGQSQFFNYLN